MSKSQKTKSRREALQSLVLRFARRRLGKRLGWGDEPLEIAVPAEGKSSLVFLVGPRDCEPVVLRLFDKAEEYDRQWRSLRHADRHGAPTPRGLYRGIGWLDQWRHGARFVAERFVPGQPPGRFGPDPAVRAAVARALARLHSIESDYHGYVDRPERAPFVETLRRRIERRLRALASAPSEIPTEEVARLHSWLLGRLEVFEGIGAFQLCHLRLGKADILYDPDAGRAWLIDCGTLRYSRASLDLANFFPSREWIGTPEAHGEFIEAYLTH
jgi:aminoglycoside phosphotransferase (APT) family kinase protein